MTGPAPEVLVVGRSRPPRRHPRPSRRTVLTLLLPLLLAAVVGVVVDHQVRRAEGARVARCAAATHRAIHSATEHVAGTIAYVRPVWAYKTPPDLRRGINRLVSEAATGTDAGLADDRRRCADVHVVALHSELRLRQAACVRLLDTYASFLLSVTAQGSRGFGPWPEVDPGC